VHGKFHSGKDFLLVFDTLSGLSAWREWPKMALKREKQMLL
jgi:hypothetical protein